MSRIAESFFGDKPAHYPTRPGFKEPTTSKLAAEKIGDQTALRAAVYARIRAMPSTADEIAAHLNESILTIRPRVSELRAANKVTPSGQRRPNASGHSAIVWIAT